MSFILSEKEMKLVLSILQDMTVETGSPVYELRNRITGRVSFGHGQDIPDLLKSIGMIYGLLSAVEITEDLRLLNRNKLIDQLNGLLDELQRDHPFGDIRTGFKGKEPNAKGVM